MWKAIIVLGISAVVVVGLWLLLRYSRARVASLDGTAKTALHPDAPQSFGYRCLWLAIQTDDPASVAGALNLRQPGPSTWKTGVQAVYDGKVFITPALDGWVLAASTSFPDTGDENTPDMASPLLERLGTRFSEVQYFATHRVVEGHAWARLVGGVFVRKFAYIGDQGIVPWDEGSPTPEEAALNAVFTRKSVEDGPFPDERSVMAIAGKWSVNPSALGKRDLPPSLGIVGSLSK